MILISLRLKLAPVQGISSQSERYISVYGELHYFASAQYARAGHQTKVIQIRKKRWRYVKNLKKAPIIKETTFVYRQAAQKIFYAAYQFTRSKRYSTYSSVWIKN